MESNCYHKFGELEKMGCRAARISFSFFSVNHFQYYSLYPSWVKKLFREIKKIKLNVKTRIKKKVSVTVGTREIHFIRLVQLAHGFTATFTPGLGTCV